MAKAKIADVTKDWIGGTDAQSDSKTVRGKDRKTEKQRMTNSQEDHVKQTVYVPRSVTRRLWFNRALTGKTIGETVTDLVMTHLPEPKM